MLLAVVLISTDPGCDPGFLPSNVISFPVQYSELSTVPVSYSIMSDTDANPTNVNVGVDDNDGHASISSAVRELCNRLRVPEANAFSPYSIPFQTHSPRSQAEVNEIVKAL